MPDPPWWPQTPADVLDSGRDRARRRPDPRRRRAVAVGGGLAALALAVIGVATWLPGEPVAPAPPTNAATPARRPSPLPADAPREVILLGSTGAGLLPTLDRPPTRTSLPSQVQQALARVVEPRQLADGRVIVLDRAAGELYAVDAGAVRDLGPAGSYFIGLNGVDVWTVRPPTLPGGPVIVQRVGADGRSVAGPATVPTGMLPVGEAADGLISIREGATPADRAVVVLDPASGAMVREIAVSASVADVRAGVVAWYHEACRGSGDCLLHLEDTRTQVRTVVPSAQGVDRTVRGDLARLSGDGTWLAYPQSLSAEPGDPLVAVFEVAVADNHGAAPRIVPESQGVFAGMVPLWSGDRLLLIRGRPPAVVGSYRPGSGTVSYGTADVSAYDEVAGALDLQPAG